MVQDGVLQPVLDGQDEVHEEISQYKRTSEFDLGSYRKELMDAMGIEVFVTGWLAQDWVRKLNKM